MSIINERRKIPNYLINKNTGSEEYQKKNGSIQKRTKISLLENQNKIKDNFFNPSQKNEIKVIFQNKARIYKRAKNKISNDVEINNNLIKNKNNMEILLKNQFKRLIKSPQDNSNNKIKKRLVDITINSNDKNSLNFTNKKTIQPPKMNEIINSNSNNNLEDYFLLNNDINNDNISFNNNEKVLYLIDNKNNSNVENYSISKDYDFIIKSNLNDKIILAKKILQLNERNWYFELREISEELKNKRDKINFNNNFNKYIKKIVNVYHHFEWLINSLGIFYNILFQNDKNINNSFIDKINLPEINSPLWEKGFKWKGLFIKIIPQNNAKYVINEIKSLNYYFFDFLQIIEKYDDNKKKQLSNNLIFPLIGYTTINNIIIFVSVIINPNRNFINNKDKNFIDKLLKEIIEYNKGYINFLDNNESSNKDEVKKNRKILYETIGEFEKDIYTKDLLNSKLFGNICEFHLIPIFSDKFLLVNVHNLIPNLFNFNFKKIHFLSIINNENIYDTVIYNKENKNFYSINNQDYISTKILLNKYNIGTNLNKIEIGINNVIFRVLYQNLEKINKNYKERTFVDNLINHYKDTKNDMEYIKGNYIIIYDLIQPIKLKYSLIKINRSNEKDINYNLSSNYISYFISWCKTLNKNNYNIKTYSGLKESMKKFGIISQLKFFALVNINNDDIADIIKISLLVKILKYTLNHQFDYKLKGNKFKNERISQIYFIINSILYTNQLSQNENTKFEKLFEDLIFYINVLYMKLKLIDDYLYLDLFNRKKLDKISISCVKKDFTLKEDIESLGKKLSEYESTKDFLKNIILIARKKPFLFLTELEYKLNFSIVPYIKFKSSISLESMYKKIKPNHIILDSNFSVMSYIKYNEISSLLFIKLINDNEKSNFNKINEDYKDINDSSNNFFINEEIDELDKDKLIHKSIRNIKGEYDNNDDKEIWNNIKNYIFINFPSICFKMDYSYEEKITQKNNSINNYLKSNYTISDYKIFHNYFSSISYLYLDIITCNGKAEQVLLHSFFNEFIIYFLIEKKDTKIIYRNIKELYSNKKYILSLEDLSIINLIQGLISDSYIESEESYSKSLILLLLLFGDPRGKNNNGHGLMLLPLWKIARKTLNLDKENPSNSQNFYEMFKCLEYYQKINSEIKSEKNEVFYNYEENVMNNIKINFELQNKIQKNKVNDNINNYFIEENYLSKNIFNDEMINLFNIKYFQFPSIEEHNQKIIQKILNSNEFIIFFIKQMESLFFGNHKIFDEKYLDKYITDNLLNLNEEEIKFNLLSKKNKNKSTINIKEDKKNRKIIHSKDKIEHFSLSQMIKRDSYQMENDIMNKNRNNNLIGEYNEVTENLNNYRTKKNNLFSHYLYDDLIEKLSYRKNCQSGIILSFGNNIYYETSQEDLKIIYYPMLLYKLKNINIKKIFSGWEHNILISDTDEIYSFGHNNKYQCGVPIIKKETKIKNPTNISILNNGIKGISAACGNEHTLILDKKNNVYSFGNNEDGVLGIGDNISKDYIFHKIDFGKYNNRIISISAGTIHNIALTDDGKIFSWGSAQGGQLGFDENFIMQNLKKNFCVQKPLIVKLKLYCNNQKTNENMKVTKISCGEAHTIIINDKNEVYSWGFGSNGQLGLGFCEDSFEIGTGLTKSRIFTPKKIKKLEKKKITNIQCGKTFSMFIDNKGEIYSCGVNDLKQLGIPESPPRNHIKNNDCRCNDFVFPTKLDYFLNMKVEKISCGEAHCLAIIKNNNNNEKIVWSWGNNRYGQLGLGDRQKFSLPKPISFLFEYNNSEFDNVSCGGFHSLCLIKSKEDLSWIENDYKNIICKIIDEIGIN